MRVAEHPFLAAGVALATAGTVAVTPVASPVFDSPVKNIATHLTADGDSLLNVPINLFNDLANVPYNEVQGIESLAESLFFSGTWWVPSATNIWGTDPGDPAKVDGIIDLLVPFPHLADGLEYQVAGYMAAELPVDPSCDAETCAPITPPDPITGVPLIDFTIHGLAVLTGLEPMDIIDNWNSVPLTELLTGYHFDSDAPGSTNPSGEAYDGFGFDAETGNGFEGGTVGDDNAMPWAGDDFTLEPAKPFEDYFDHLMAPPSTDGVLGTGIEVPETDEIGRALQSVLASMTVDFDPFTEGSSLCPGDCSLITGLGLDYPDLVEAIGDAWPGNDMIDEWLDAWADGTANAPTDEQIEHNIDATAQLIDPLGLSQLLDPLGLLGL